MKKSGSKKGTKVEKELLQQLLKLLRGYEFPGGILDTDPSETNLRPVAAYITEKIIDYLKINDDADIIDLIRSKTGEDWEAYLENNPHRGLLDPKTLKNLLSQSAPSPSRATLSILKAFSSVVSKEEEKMKHLRKVFGRYNVFNSHNRTTDFFQISNIKISERETYISYLSRRYTEEGKKDLEVEIVGKDKLLLTLNDVDCRLIFYAAIGMRKDPPFFQAPFIYNNDRGETMAGLAIFARIDQEENFLKPARKQSELPDAFKKIQHYLLNYCPPITPVNKDTPPFNFEKNDIPGPSPFNNFPAKFYEKMRDTLCGDFAIYFTERFSSIESHYKAFHSTIGVGRLAIFEDKKTGVLRCTMVVRKDRRGEDLTFSGNLINHKLDNSSNVLMSMYVQPHNDRMINLLLNIVNDHLLIGSHSISYSPPNALGAGTVVMVRIEAAELKRLPAAINPIQYDFNRPFLPSAGNIEQNIVTLLSKKQHSLVKIPSYHQLKQHIPLRYAGLYKIYSYAKGGNIRLSTLKLYPNGFVEHKGYSKEERPLAIGKAEMVRSIINITLLNQENKRTGFMCIRVDEVTPVNDATYYAGTFSGVSRRDGEFPLASVILLAFVNQEDPLESIKTGLFSSNDPAYQELPPAVQKMFQGKTNNFTLLPGIYNYQGLEDYVKKDVLDFGQIYFDAACQAMENGETEKGKNLLVLANQHGFKNPEQKISDYLKPKLLERAVYQKLQGEQAKVSQTIQVLNRLFEEDWGALIDQKYQEVAEKIKKEQPR
ncbi:MAG: hypothetical protein DHS20C18_10580 [Saprospiraceae bacterium]|nr:MAG: hypothetical protein DHS20C18_10580 [Saprospiraceae bacterium]